MKTRLIAALMLGTAVATLGPVACNSPDASEQLASTPGTELGIRPDWMDTSANPGDDFFRYADGKWYDETEIPADRSSVGGFFIADQQTTLEGLSADVCAALGGGDPACKEERVFIRADPEVTYNQFMEVMNELQRRGFFKVGLLNEDIE